ncbi:MAG: hypothetical protein DMF89_17405 [Acidobacteria bacterium]|nr:MAG: hypothetical protein DMF90_24200 [Acidobacteriota bacterium]PYR47974.1 MAG: hypothetical protein DMF89_17405 [Acidobacteriota bacterium]
MTATRSARFYRVFPASVTIGIEATGAMGWFLQSDDGQNRLEQVSGRGIVKPPGIGNTVESGMDLTIMGTTLPTQPAAPSPDAVGPISGAALTTRLAVRAET